LRVGTGRAAGKQGQQGGDEERGFENLPVHFISGFIRDDWGVFSASHPHVSRRRQCSRRLGSVQVSVRSADGPGRPEHCLDFQMDKRGTSPRPSA
jgi:hypothetical protein